MPTTSTSSSEPRVPHWDLTSATARTTERQPSSALPERSGEKASLGAELGAVDRVGSKVFLMPTSALSFVTNTTTFSSLGLSSVGSVQWLSSFWPFFFFQLFILYWHMGFLGGLAVKNLPTVPDTWVQSLGWEDPLEKGMATHSSILTWRIHRQRSLVGYSPWGCRESKTTQQQMLTMTNSWFTVLP